MSSASEVFTIGQVDIPVDEFRKRWAEDLRSGKYEQAKGQLKCNGGFCCLGVAAETLRKMGVPLEWESNDLVVPGYENTFELELPAYYDDLLGASQSFCINWNDDLGYSFKRIANTLEKHWKRGLNYYDED